MYGANVMDGKFKVMRVEEIVRAAASGAEGGAPAMVKDEYYSEVAYGVQCIEHFNVSGNELIVAGLGDGTIQVFDYTKNKDKAPVQRPVFRVQRSDGHQAEEDRPANLDHPYDNFLETLYEHSGPVTAIEKNFKNTSVFASGGKDSKVFIWNLEGEEEVEFVGEINKQQLYKPGGSSLN